MKNEIISFLIKYFEIAEIYWRELVEWSTNMNETEIYWTAILASAFFLYLVYRVLNFLVMMFMMFGMIFAYAIYSSGMYKVLLEAMK